MLQDLLKAIGPFEAGNSGIFLVLLWVPAVVVSIVLMRVLWKKQPPRGFLIIAMGLALSAMFFALSGAVQAFEHLSFTHWAMLSGAQLAAVALVGFQIWVQRAKIAPGTVDNFVAEWRRNRKVILVVLLGMFALGAYGTRNFIDYVTADAVTATVVAKSETPDTVVRHIRTINAEWASPEGKKIPLLLAFDSADAFRPPAPEGAKLPVRIRAAEVAAGKTDPLYMVDMGLPVTLLAYLSQLVTGLAGLAAFFAARKEA